jgi:hypothetical protein
MSALAVAYLYLILYISYTNNNQFLSSINNACVYSYTLINYFIFMML